VRTLVTGANGQLGQALAEILSERDHEVVFLFRTELDVAAPEAVERAIWPRSPELVVNAAAYTDLDGCETEGACAVDALGPCNLAQFCARSGCELLHIGTNYVFDGEKEGPYEPFDPPRPISSPYGCTKLAGGST
jgi:dTDP-4-dehydrorhamnose reductase